MRRRPGGALDGQQLLVVEGSGARVARSLRRGDLPQFDSRACDGIARDIVINVTSAPPPPPSATQFKVSLFLRTPLLSVSLADGCTRGCVVSQTTPGSPAPSMAPSRPYDGGHGAGDGPPPQRSRSEEKSGGGAEGGGVAREAQRHKWPDRNLRGACGPRIRWMSLRSRRWSQLRVWLLVFLSWVCHRWRTLRLKPSMVAPSVTSSK